MQSRVYTHGRPGSPSMHRYRSAAGETLHAAGSLKTSADHHPPRPGRTCGMLGHVKEMDRF